MRNEELARVLCRKAGISRKNARRQNLIHEEMKALIAHHEGAEQRVTSLRVRLATVDPDWQQGGE